MVVQYTICKLFLQFLLTIGIENNVKLGKKELTFPSLREQSFMAQNNKRNSRHDNQLTILVSFYKYLCT